METALYVLKNQEDRYVLVRDARTYTVIVEQRLSSKFTRERAQKFLDNHPGHGLRKVKLTKASLKSQAA